MASSVKISNLESVSSIKVNHPIKPVAHFKNAPAPVCRFFKIKKKKYAIKIVYQKHSIEKIESKKCRNCILMCRSLTKKYSKFFSLFSPAFQNSFLNVDFFTFLLFLFFFVLCFLEFISERTLSHFFVIFNIFRSTAALRSCHLIFTV